MAGREAQPENSASVRSASASQDRRAASASSAFLMPEASPRAWALASCDSSVEIAFRSWLTVPSARATASGLDRFHWFSSARRTASSTFRYCSSPSVDSQDATLGPNIYVQ